MRFETRQKRVGPYWELSKSLDRMLEMTGRSVITAVVSTCSGQAHGQLAHAFPRRGGKTHGAMCRTTHCAGSLHSSARLQGSAHPRLEPQDPH